MRFFFQFSAGKRLKALQNYTTPRNGHKKSNPFSHVRPPIQCSPCPMHSAHHRQSLDALWRRHLDLQSRPHGSKSSRNWILIYLIYLFIGPLIPSPQQIWKLLTRHSAARNSPHTKFPLPDRPKSGFSRCPHPWSQLCAGHSQSQQLSSWSAAPMSQPNGHSESPLCRWPFWMEKILPLSSFWPLNMDYIDLLTVVVFVAVGNVQ